MTNNEAIYVKQLLTALEQEHFKMDTKVKLTDKVFFVIRKNNRIISPVIKEVEAIKADIKDAFKKEVELDEEKYGKDKDYQKEIDEKYKEFNKKESINTQFKEFGEANFEKELHLLTEEEIEECVLDSGTIDELVKYLT